MESLGRVGVSAAGTSSPPALAALWLDSTLSLRASIGSANLLTTFTGVLRSLSKREGKELFLFALKHDYLTKLASIARRTQNDKSLGLLHVAIVEFFTTLFEIKHIAKRLRAAKLPTDVVDCLVRVVSASPCDERLIKSVQSLKPAT
jgi:hypothetical protein